LYNWGGGQWQGDYKEFKREAKGSFQRQRKMKGPEGDQVYYLKRIRD